MLLLAPGLPGPRIELRVVRLWRTEVPFAASCDAAGIPVEALGWSAGSIAGAAVRQAVGCVLRLQPDVIHAWGAGPACAALGSSRAKRHPAVVRSADALPGRTVAYSAGRSLAAAPSGSWSLAGGEAEAWRCSPLGVAAETLAVVPPAVRVVQRRGDRRRCRHDYPACAPCHRCAVGPLEPHKGFRDAVWAFDILRFLYDDLHLVLVGDGSGAAASGASSCAAPGHAAHVHFLGDRADVPALLARAELVWVPSRTATAGARGAGGDGGGPAGGGRAAAASWPRSSSTARRACWCRRATRRPWRGRPGCCSTTPRGAGAWARRAGSGREAISPPRNWCGVVEGAVSETGRLARDWPRPMRTRDPATRECCV